MDIYTLDIETYSEYSLKEKKGVASGSLFHYATHPSTEIIVAALKKNKESTQIFDLTTNQKTDFFRILKDISNGENNFIVAHNANFEFALFEHCVGIKLDPWRSFDTADFGRYFNLPMVNLDYMSNAICKNSVKMKEGKDLISIFSITDKYNRRVMPSYRPVEWELFKEYCKVDVDTCSELFYRMFDRIPKQEIDLMRLTLCQNLKGIKINKEYMENALRVEKNEFDYLADMVQRELGINNAKSGSQVKQAYKDRGINILSLSKTAIPELIEEYPEEEQILSAVQILNSKTSAKFSAANKRLVDGCVRGSLVYSGAVTGRWSSKGLQIHNFSSKSPSEEVKKLLSEKDYEKIDTIKKVNEGVRSMLIPREGCKFVVADYSQIEARLMAAYSGANWKVNVFNTTGLIYEEAAARMFGVSVDSCKKDGENKDLRQKGKVCELALQYGGGPDAIVKSIGDPQEASNLVDKWRKVNYHIMNYRKTLKEACVRAIQEGKRSKLNDGAVYISNTPIGLCITLNNALGKRDSFFPNVKVSERHDKYALIGSDGEEITHLAGIKISQKLKNHIVNDKEFTFAGKQYEANGKEIIIRKKGEEVFRTRYEIKDDSYNTTSLVSVTDGGLISRFEPSSTVIQGTARDLLAESMLNLHILGSTPLFHVHDELICEVEDLYVEEVCVYVASVMNFNVFGVKISANPEVMEYYSK